VDEVGSAVERIDDPWYSASGVLARLLGDTVIAKALRTTSIPPLGGAVDARNEIIGTLDRTCSDAPSSGRG
jgi:hypothetical protein